jgi:hypothetical protein
MEYIWMILWLVIIAIEVWANWFKIEVKGVSPKHWLWFIPRLGLGALFLWIFKGYGYEYIWSATFLVGTHGFLYTVGLNKARDKGLGYLGDPNLKNKKKSLYDKILLWISDSEAFKFSWLAFRFIFFIFAVGQMIIQGKCTWFQINNNGCL